MSKVIKKQVPTREQLLVDQDLPKGQIAQCLEEFKEIVHGKEGQGKAITLRVPEHLLSKFKVKAKRESLAYQSQIIELMRQWISKK